MSVEDWVRDLASELPRVVRQALKSLIPGAGYLSDIDLDTDSTLLFSLRFAGYMAALEMLLNIPTARALVGEKEYFSTGYSLSYFCATYLHYLALPFLFFLVYRLVRGRASLRQSVAAYGFLTVFGPLTKIALLPVQLPLYRTIRVIGKEIQDVTFIEYSIRLTEVVESWSRWQVLLLLLFFLVVSVVQVVYFYSVHRAFRVINHLTAVRAIIGFCLGLTLYAAFLTLFLFPVFSRLYVSFGVE